MSGVLFLISRLLLTPALHKASPRPPLIKDGFLNDILLKASAPVFPDPGEACAREAAEARGLESKVARVTSKKCSVEEVTAAEADRVPSSSSSPSLTVLHPQSSALFLSSLLLKEILANYVAFSDASKTAKHAEASLKMDKLELKKGRLEVELHKCVMIHIFSDIFGPDRFS
jgi:hypothetical protein